MSIERYRKDAKALARAHRAGEADATARARAVLGHRAGERFLLSDAQHVIANESGYRSWSELRAAQPRELVTEERYAPDDPVVVRLTKHRHLLVDDGGGGVARAGTPPGWRGLAERLADELVVNISRGGVVSLPVVARCATVDEIVARVAHASAVLYEELLELGG
jgi:hypothetical protein